MNWRKYCFGIGFYLAVPILDAFAVDATVAVTEELRIQERERHLLQKQEQKPNISIEKPQPETADIPDSETPCFQINKIVINDESGKFNWALSELISKENDIIPRCLGNQGISAIMKKIQNIIVAKGYVTTRISAKPQDLTKGELELSATAGRVKNILLTKDSSSRATVVNALPVAQGDIVNLYDIEQGLENFKRLPTVDADIKFIPSTDADSQSGDSDIQVMWAQKFPVRLNASIDDSGSKSTGKYQLSSTVSVDHVLLLNDIFYVSANKDLGGGDKGGRGTNGSSFHYSVPFGYWLLTFNASMSSYFQTISGDTQDYIYSGNSISRDIKLTKLLYRDRKRKTKFSASGWMRSSRSFIDDIPIDTQRRDTVGVDISVNHLENTKYVAIDTTVTYSRGLDRLDALKAPESSTDGGSSFPRIIKADISINAPFAIGGQNFSYMGNAHIQKNQTPLIPNDYFSIGGRYTVRGFDGTNTLSGERAFTLKHEVAAINTIFGIDGYIGLDYGEVGGRNAYMLPGKSLTGGYLGARGRVGYFFYDLFVGAPLQKPHTFKTSPLVTGFSIGLSI